MQRNAVEPIGFALASGQNPGAFDEASEPGAHLVAFNHRHANLGLGIDLNLSNHFKQVASGFDFGGAKSHEPPAHRVGYILGGDALSINCQQLVGPINVAFNELGGGIFEGDGFEHILAVHENGQTAR